MIRQIYNNIAADALIGLICLCCAIYAVSIGELPPVNPVCELRLAVARYEAVEPSFMDDQNKEGQWKQ